MNIKVRTPILIAFLGNVCVINHGLTACAILDVKQEETLVCQNITPSELTTIDAMNFTTVAEGVLKVGGNVCINMGSQQISTQELFYNDSQQTLAIQSPLIYKDDNQIINAKTANVDMAQEKAELLEVLYQLKQSNANGSAQSVITDKANTQLRQLTYSTCPASDKQWYIEAESADLDQESQTGVFRKMTLRFKGVPILYFPYAKLPLTNKRQSGLLIPEIGNSSRNGFDISLPYYFNIAENQDATLTPRYISKRGAMMAAEYRYLGKKFKGEIYADYLPSDKIENKDRGLVELKHFQQFNSNWFLNSRYNNVSDENYFHDFGNSINDTSRSFLYSFLNINGFGNNWDFKGQLNDFQIISENISLTQQPYQAVPSLEYSWYNNSYSSTLNYGIDSQWSNFYRDQSITSARLDVLPYIEKTFQNSYSRFTPRLSYRYTHWDYSNTEHSSIENLTDNRALPITTLDYSINFEKQFSDGRYSSIEPRLYYVYSPFRNQQNIPLFDTHALTFGTGLLYQSNAFSGADRQSDTNQLSLGITQRNFDAKGNEKWNLTVGQIAYFEDRRVQLTDAIETDSTSPIITEFNYFYRNWKATMSVHWNTNINKSERALLKFQHKGHNNSLFNFAYRFRRGKIEQLDTSVVLPIGFKNRFIARWNYSIGDNKTIEAIAGIEHKNCCWATRLVARRYVINEEGDVNNGLFFELQLNGLGALGRNPRRLLKQSILGYTEEF